MQTCETCEWWNKENDDLSECQLPVGPDYTGLPEPLATLHAMKTDTPIKTFANFHCGQWTETPYIVIVCAQRGD